MSDEPEITDEPADPDLGEPVTMDADGFERASIADLRERVAELEERVERNEELIQMAAQRLREQRQQETNADANRGP